MKSPMKSSPPGASAIEYRRIDLWLAALIGMTVLSQSVGTAYTNSFTLPNTESTQALDPAAGGRAERGRRPGADRRSTPPTGPRSPIRPSRPR